MSLLALLDDRPRYGLQLKQKFDAMTGEIWPLNVGQVYTTLGRLERDGFVETAAHEDAQRTYRITAAGREHLAAWFARPQREGAPARDELVLKLILAAARGPERLQAVIRSERKAAVESLQDYTRLKREPAHAADLGWLLLLDSLIFKAESRIRWLDAARARIAQQPAPATDPGMQPGRVDADTRAEPPTSSGEAVGRSTAASDVTRQDVS